MQWCLLLIWAQGLRQAPLLASGAVVTLGNISAEEGGSVTLQCHLSSTTTMVTQVDWEHQDQYLATHNAELGWYISPAFRERVVPAPHLGLTLQSLTRNDTGGYSCVYHTFPEGIYRGTLFLEVLQSSGAEHSAGFKILLLGVILLVVICSVVTVVVALTRKKKFLRIRSADSSLGRGPPAPEERRPSVASSPGGRVPAEAAPGGLCTEQGAEDNAEPHDYFNVLSYKSLADISFLAETG